MTKDEAVILLCEHFSEGMVRTIFDAIAKDEALEKKDEPVAWEQFHEHMAGPNYVAPQRTWVGLTEQEIERTYMDTINFQENARILEDILKEKNI